MKLKVLGSSGAEMPEFHPPAFLLDNTILLDAGTVGAVLDGRAQWKIKHILLTHAHLDHIRGIPFLADNILINDKKHTVTIASIPPVLRTLKRNLLNGSVWPDFTVIPNKKNPVLKLKNIKVGVPFEINSHTITAYRVTHTVPATGYLVQGPNGRTLLYTGDTGPTEKIWREIKTPLNCAIIEVSLPDRMKQMAVLTGHLTPGLLEGELRKMHHIPERILITHPKPQFRKQIIRELDKLGRDNITVLTDGEEYKI